VTGITALVLDVDGEAFKSKEEALIFCYRNPKLTPTYVVDSGNGYHAYFKFHHIIDVTTDEQRDKIREMGRRLKATYEDGHLFEGVKGGLDSVFDTPRVLRLPGTFNCKTSERKPVRIISDPILSGNTYSIDDFDNLLIKTDKIKVITAENIQSVCSLSSVEWSSQDEDDFLFLCGMNDGKNKRFIDYCNGQFHGDRSKAELNLCGNLYWYFRTQKHLTHDEALSKADAKIRSSLYREKWDKIHRKNPDMTYAQMTLAKVTLDRKEGLDAQQQQQITLPAAPTTLPRQGLTTI
jgi:hypothetical protein